MGVACTYRLGNFMKLHLHVAPKALIQFRNTSVLFDERLALLKVFEHYKSVL